MILKQWKKALIKYDLRLEDTATSRQLRHDSLSTSALKPYDSLGCNSQMNLALKKTLVDYDLSQDTVTLIFEFFQAGYDFGDFELMSDIITEYDCPLDKSNIATSSTLAYAAIEGGHYDLAKALNDQYSISANYLPEDLTAPGDDDKTLGKLLAYFEAKNLNSPTSSIKETLSHADLIKAERVNNKEKGYAIG
jgi:hypothetical protein